MSRQGKSQGGFPGRNDEKNQENRSTQKRPFKRIQHGNDGNLYEGDPDELAVISKSTLVKDLTDQEE